MKTLLFVLCLVSFSAQAEVIISGGFGTDGATGESLPTKQSVKQAAQVYEALNVKADAKEDKVIAVADESQFTCERPYSGISRFNAGCQFTLRASQKGILTRNGRAQDLTFSGKLATKIFNALPAPTSTRVGATSKKAGNIACTKVVRPGVEASCTVKGVFAISMDVKL